MRNVPFGPYLALVCLINFVALPQILSAQTFSSVYSKQGDVDIKTAGANAWQPAVLNLELHAQDTIRTGPESRAALLMGDGVMVRLNENSIFQLRDPNSADEVLVESGSVHFLSRNPASFPTVKTPLVTASVRGTEFVVESSAKLSRIAVLQGNVVAENSFGKAQLGQGEEALIEPGKAPKKGLLLNPIDAVQWALYYPAVLDLEDLADFNAQAKATRPAAFEHIRQGDYGSAAQAFSGSTPIDIFGQAVSAFFAGDYDKSSRMLDTIPQPWSSSHLLLRSALLLARGQAERASGLQSIAAKQIESLSASDREPLERLLHSQQALVALAQNKNDEARAISERSLNLPSSPTAAISRSYVLQSQFSIEAAKTLIEQALISHPENSFLLARHAELLLAFGYADEGYKEALKASELASNDFYALTIRGFCELALFDRNAARNSFNAAVALASGSGLPYLGLGLVQIRENDLVNGRRLIQQAVHLEPSVALYRSYLGKALFEQDQEELAAEEYDRAITLDPNDPTAYLYRAYQRLSKNRPIDALRDVEKSIELNDNRAVYRSRLLLDQDSAVRSGSLSQVYQNLGFSELARTEAIKSLSRDYSNYSAHLMLSQSYSQTTDLTQASISEFLIARLLSPVNFNLVRPSQGGTVSLNEYTALFDRSMQRFSLESTARTKDRAAEPTLALSGTQDRLGYTLSYSSTYSDGYRTNDRLVDHTVYGSLQYQLTPEDTLLLDMNLDYYDSNDTQVGYDPYLNDTNSSQSQDDYIGRFGFNHRFSPGSKAIAQLLFNDSELIAKDPDFPRILINKYLTAGEVIADQVLLGEALQRTAFHSKGVRADAQHIFDSSSISTINGVAALESSHEQREHGAASFDDFPDTLLSSSADNTEGSRRVFNYTTFHLAPWLDLQGGATYAHLHLSGSPLSVPVLESTETFDEVSPKAGFIFTPTQETTVRGAFFESIGSSGIRELEVIEPTIVGGFNQSFFDIFPGTRARNFALGIDQKLPYGTYVGVEGLRRHVIRHFNTTFDALLLDAESGEITGKDILLLPDSDYHHDENILKSHLYKVLGDSFSATVDYALIRSQDESVNTLSRTNRIRFGINYFESDGFLAFSSATWRDQELDGFDETLADTRNGTRDFWIVDSGVGYRIPKRHGLITLSATNLLDKSYRYLPTDSDPLFFPGIGAELKFAYNF